MSDYKALYRKWRPVDFDDVCGQTAVTDILKYEVRNNKLSHAYLFCGSRGTGKTSCAKILAKAVNCLNVRDGNPCNQCEACRSIDAGISTDVIEMDAASNNGVDNVRMLQDEISFTPATLKYRVYIVDEVHMMSTQAFNALLKTLEEPPSYVIFILATTEFHKLPTTIVSRCQRFDFKRISSEVIIDRLLHIAKHEGIDVDRDGARLIARAAKGGMRDAVSLLDLLSGSGKHIDTDAVARTVGALERELAYKMISAIADSDFSTVYSIVNDITARSADLSVFWQELIDSYRDVMLIKNARSAREYLDLTDVEYAGVLALAEKFTMTKLVYHTSILESTLADLQRAGNSKRSIAEIALTRMCDSKLVMSFESMAQRIEDLEKQVAIMKFSGTAPSQASVSMPPQREIAQAAAVEPETHAPADNARFLPFEELGVVLDRIGAIKPSLRSAFKGAEVLCCGCDFIFRMQPFFATRLAESPSDAKLIMGVIAEQMGVPATDLRYKVETLSGTNAQNPRSDFDRI